MSTQASNQIPTIYIQSIPIHIDIVHFLLESHFVTVWQDDVVHEVTRLHWSVRKLESAISEIWLGFQFFELVP